MKIVLSHPTGNEFFRAAVKGFSDADKLNGIYTSIASFPGTLLYRLGGLNGFSDIRRRALKTGYKKCTHIHPLRELGRLAAVKAHHKRLTKHETGILSVDAVYRNFDKYVAGCLEKEKRKKASAVYAYEDGALASFLKARELKLKTFYDLPIGYWRTMHNILSEEKELNPGWAVTLDGLKDSNEKLARKDEELKLSNAVFVASSFTAKTLHDYPGSLPAVHIVPYGFPAVTPKNYQDSKSQKIKLLFVGGLSQRKGLSYLFDAVNSLENFVELTVVGRLPQITCEPLNRELCKHKYISSLPHEKILQLMREHDVLVFPSLFEGFGQVITEAMAQGMPVITTERTAGPDIIRHGENGWLVNAGSAEAIKNILEQVILNPPIIADVGEQALETAKKRPWSVYGKELVKAVLMES